MLSLENKDTIDNKINKYDKLSIVIVIVNNMRSAYIGIDSLETATERFSSDLYHSWGIGDIDKENGAIIFLSIGDRTISIAYGKAMLEFTTIDTIEKMMKNHVSPLVKKRKFIESILGCLQDLELILDGRFEELNHIIEKDIYYSFLFSASNLFYICFFFIVVIFVYRNKYSSSKVTKEKKWQIE
jgi:uncharacterized membrane protein YgcG